MNAPDPIPAQPVYFSGEADTVGYSEPIEVAPIDDTVTPTVAEIPLEDRKREVWRREDGMLIKRLSTTLMGRRVGVMYLCLDCFEANREGNLIAMRDEDSGAVELHCRCTVRTLEGVR